MKKLIYSTLVCTVSCVNTNAPSEDISDTTDFKRGDDDSVIYVEGWGLIHWNVTSETIYDEEFNL